MNLTDRAFAPPPNAPPPSHTTPAGLQANGKLAVRRAFVLIVNLVTWALLLRWAASILASGGWSATDAIVFVCMVFGTPWAVLGFWNAVIGLWLLHGPGNAEAATAPFLAAPRRGDPITLKTAIFMTLRNEDPGRAISRLEVVKRSLDATGEGGNFSYFLLSDTSLPDVALGEEAAVAAWQARAGGPSSRITYRRRTGNAGYKAGNVRDFCETYGRNFDLMVPLDADSLMTGAAIVELVRIMQAYPRIGILQSLVVGMPSLHPLRGFSNSECVSECAATRWVKRGGLAIAVRSGATMPLFAYNPSPNTARFRSCRGSRRSVGTFCPTIRLRRR